MNFRTEKSSHTLKLVFSGKLDLEEAAKLWRPCLELVTREAPPSLVLDLTEVDYCDGAGIALIGVLQKHQVKLHHHHTICGLKPQFQKLLNYIEEQPSGKEQDFISEIRFPERLGRIAVNVLKNFRYNVTFLGNLFYQLGVSLSQPKKIRWRDVLRVAEDTGPQAVPIIALIGFLIGLISTFQAAPSFENFGAQIYLINLVGLGLVREMGPLLTAVLLAGRTASAFAAEIGTMKINQELDALKTMGLEPVRFLVVPRILVTMLITPILEVFFIIFGLLGCLTVMYTLGYTVDTFFHQLRESIVSTDYIGGLVKVFVFGLVIAGVGCLHGIKTKFNAQAVGHSTTQAVVSSLIMLVVVDGVFALVYYILDI